MSTAVSFTRYGTSYMLRFDYNADLVADDRVECPASRPSVTSHPLRLCCSALGLSAST